MPYTQANRGLAQRPGGNRLKRLWPHAAGLVLAVGAGASGWRLREAQALPERTPEFALLLAETGAAADAVRGLDARLRRDPHDNEALLALGAARESLGDAAGAAAARGAVARESPYFPAAQRQAGTAALARNDAVAAEAAFRAAYERGAAGSADWLAAVSGLLRIGNARDQTAECEAFALAAMPHVAPPERGKMWDEITIRRSSKREDRERPERLRRYIKGNPADSASRAALAQSLADDARSDEGLEILRPAVAETPADPAVWHAWLRCLHDQGDHPGLAAALGRVPPENEKQGWLWRYRAAAKLHAGDAPGAAAAIAEALRRTPDDPDLNLEAARIAARAGRPELTAAASVRAKQRGALLDAQRNAWQAWSKANAEMAPYAETAAAGQTLAKCCADLGYHDAANYYRAQAAEFARIAASPAP